MSCVLLKLKDSAAPVELQEMSTTEENYLAYQVGLGFTTLDSSDVGQLGIDLSGSYNTVGTLTDTYLDSAVGTHNNLFTITTVDSIVKQETGTVAITDSDYRIPVFQKDSDGQRIIREMNDTELDAIADRINSRIYLSDYPGTYKLATSAPSGDYTEYLSSVTTDTRTDGTALPYNLYRRTSMTAPTVIRPFAIKRRGGVERINGSSNSAITQGGMSIVQGEWYQLDVDVVHTGGNDLVKFYMNDGSGMGNINVSRSGSGHLTHTFRATATATIEFRVSFGTDFRGYIMNTSMRKVLTSGGKTRLDANLITNSTFDTDTSGWAINAIPNTYRWIDGRVERYNGSGNSPITQYIDIVDGEWYQVDWDVDYDSGDDQTNLWIDIGDGNGLGNQGSVMNGGGHQTVYFQAGSTKSMLFRLYTIDDFRGYLDNVTIKQLNYNPNDDRVTTDANGSGSKFKVVVDASGAATIDVEMTGDEYVIHETVTVPDSLLGDGGAADLTFDVATITEHKSAYVGDEFTLGFWAYNDTGTNIRISLAGQGGWCGSNTTSNAQWTFYQATGTASQDYDTITIDKRSQGTNTSTDFYIDRIVLVRGHKDLNNGVV